MSKKNKTINFCEKTCIISKVKGLSLSGDNNKSYYQANDKQRGHCVGVNVSLEILTNQLHQTFGYHVFEILDDIIFKK